MVQAAGVGTPSSDDSAAFVPASDLDSAVKVARGAVRNARRAFWITLMSVPGWGAPGAISLKHDVTVAFGPVGPTVVLVVASVVALARSGKTVEAWNRWSTVKDVYDVLLERFMTNETIRLTDPIWQQFNQLCLSKQQDRPKGT